MRFFEALPGLLSWSTLIAVTLLSWRAPAVIAVFIILFDIYWLFRTIYLSIHLRAGYAAMKQNLKISWLEKLRGNDWEKIYEDTLSDIEKNNIIKALEKAVAENNFLRPEKIFGKQIQDREGQITFSVLGDGQRG